MAPQMFRTQDWPGRTMFDRNHQKIGKIDDIFYDKATGRPEWALVNTGLFGTRESVVPVTQARVTGDDIEIPFEKDLVKGAPNVDAEGELSRDDESTLANHYGVEYNDAFSKSGLPGGRAAVDTGQKQQRAGRRAGRSTDDAMTRSEEQLDVSKAHRPSELVRLKKEIVTENQQVTVPVQHEELRVEREPITDENRDAALSGPDLREGTHDLTLDEEQVEVNKKVVPKERVRVDKDVSTEQRTIDEPIRKEKLDVERNSRR